jgi:K+-transporting ATPase c subunit
MFSFAEIASQYPVKVHSAATTRSSRNGAMISSSSSGLDFRLRWTRISPAASRMQTYMVAAWRSMPQ